MIMVFKRWFLTLCLLVTGMLQAQEIELEKCIEAVKKNYPLLKQLELEKGINEIANEVTGSAWMPQINLNAQATYQSDVTGLDVPMGGLDFQKLEKDQYRATVDINQTLYDGNATKYKKQLQNLATEISNYKVKIEIRNAVKLTQQYFFSGLAAQENEKIWRTTLDEINERLKVLQSGVKNGTVKQSQVDVLEVETIKIEQKLLDIKATRNVAKKVIELFSGLKIDLNSPFVLPNDLGVVKFDFSEKAEMKSFKIQEEVADKQLKSLNAKLKPKLSAFAQGGYGNPGLNQLKNEFTTFYMIGAKLNWDLSSFYNKRRYKNSNKLTKEEIDVQVSTLELNLNAQRKVLEAELEELEQTIEKDKEIIKLRSKISKVASVELDNGIITATNYLIEKNAEKNAMQSQINHTIQKLSTKYEIKLLNE